MFHRRRPSAEMFEQLCAPYAPMVYRHCLHMLRNPHEAEDAAQESMLRAFRAFDSFRGSGAASWLFRIAHNTCLDILKSARYQRESAVLDGSEYDLRDDAPTPEAAYVRRMEEERLWQAVLALPQEQQTLLNLYYGEGLAYEAIAEATGLRMGTVKSRLSRAKETLRKHLSEAGEPFEL